MPTRVEPSDFSTLVSHEVKAPLRGIHSIAETMIEEYRSKPLGDDGVALLGRMSQVARMLANVVDDLLRLTAPRGALHRESVNVTALAREVLKELELQEPKRRVEVDVDVELRADADEGLLRIALANLLGNAWKYTSGRERAHIVIGRAAFHDGETAFFIRDDGIGFDPTQARDMFRPFHRLANAAGYGGTGLGLAIAERVTTLHGGRLWAEGAVGEGSTFWFTLVPRPVA
jgi:signal transduction histidine kinase